MNQPVSQPPLPLFEVRLTAPDLGPWLAGNTGIRGFTTQESGKPGPHVAILALAHGNELAGAIVLEQMLRADFRPRRGRLTLGFVNLAAFQRFDPRQPTTSRFVEEDMNRVWDDPVLDGARRSVELDRAREIRPLLDTVDVLLDLHSMLWPSKPLILCGETAKGCRLASHIGVPGLVIADQGHAVGRRIIDYRRFADPDSACAASLIEAGQHWEPGTVDTTRLSIAGLLHHLEIGSACPALPPPRQEPQRFAEVTDVITATTSNFAFVQPFRGGDMIPERNTLIALDGGMDVRTPYDDCLLVMPSLRPSRGHTAVRLGRFVPLDRTTPAER